VKKTDLHPKILQLLESRKISSDSLINDYFSDEKLSSPLEMTNIVKICQRIKKAIDNKEQIVICGDYDADGTVSTAMMYRFFKEINYPVDWYIPHRVEEGYGISALGVEKLVSEKKAQLLISVDNGIAAFDAAKKSIELGVDLIITDHHDLIDDKIPDCFAVLNPKIDDPNKKYRYLSGAGVALYLLRALKQYLKVDVNLDKYLILATIASVADVVPLMQENRILVKKGIEILKKKYDSIIGLKYLIEESGLKLNFINNLTSKDIGYKIAPILNAAGRLEGAEKTILLLIEDDSALAKKYAKDLKNLNLKRREESDSLYQRVYKECKFDDSVLVFSGEDYHQGIIGVVAGRLKHELNKPVIVISIDSNGIGKASCRSIEGYNIKEAMESLNHLHLGGGGHYMAAGFSIKKENIEEFRVKINEHFKLNFNKSKEKPSYDIELTKEDIDKNFLTQLSLMEPFGAKNESPKVKYKGQITSITVVNEKHLSITLDNKLNCWFFFEAEQLKSIQSKFIIEVIGDMSSQKNGTLIIDKVI